MTFKFNFQLVLISTLAMGLLACKQESGNPEKVKPVSDTLAVKKAGNNAGFNVAFIYGDSVNLKYQFLLDAESELESERKRIDRRLQTKLQEAEKRAAELQKQAPTMTQTQMQEAQLEMQNLDLEMQRYQEKLGQDFRKRESELQLEYIDKVNAYLDEYNADGTYDMVLNFQQGGNLLWIKQAYNITDEVIKGLNEAYENEMSQKNTDKQNP